MLPFIWLLTIFIYTCQIQEQEFQGKMYYAEIHVVCVFYERKFMGGVLQLSGSLNSNETFSGKRTAATITKQCEEI